MPASRYVVLGLAQVRADWFRQVARWSTAGSLPVDFVKCVGVAEVRARLETARAHSALLVDAGVVGVDRDLLDLARDRGCVPIVIDDARIGHDWLRLGAATILPSDFGHHELLDALADHATMISRAKATRDGQRSTASAISDLAAVPGRLVAVTGSGGTGASTVAIALAQSYGGWLGDTGKPVLADLKLHAEHAMLHDTQDVVPGLLELVDLHRHHHPSPDEIRDLTFEAPQRGYHLLLGLRRHRDWAALRPRSLTTALSGLQHSFPVVVADVDADLEGEDECGSAEIDERNLLARTTIGNADAVVVVGAPSMKGIHSMVRVIGEVVTFGVPLSRVLPVINRAPRNQATKSSLSRTYGQLVAGLDDGAGGSASPVFLPDKKRLDETLRERLPLPSSIAGPLATAAEAIVDRALTRPLPDEPALISPGSLGSWSEGDVADDEFEEYER